MNTTKHTREPPKPRKKQKRITLNFKNMKTKHYLTTFLVVLTLNTFAQLDKKTWLVGGNASFDSRKREYTNYYGDPSNPTIYVELYKQTVYEINPKAGYFVLDKLALGLSSSFLHSRGNRVGSSSPVSHGTTFSIGPFARYYFLDKNKSFNVFTEATYQLGSIKNNGDTTLKSPITKYAAMAGVELFFNSSAGIEFLAGYNYQKQNGDREIHGGQIQQFEDKGFKIAIGFQLHLFKE